MELRRTHGVASLAPGSLEVKLQRNVGHLIGPPGNDSVAAVAAIDVLLGDAGTATAPASAFAASALALRAAVHERIMLSAVYAVERCASACRPRRTLRGRLLSADTDRSACTQAKVTILDFLGAYSSRSWR